MGSRAHEDDSPEREKIMWLTLIIVGIALVLLGVFVEAAKFLIWLGIVLLVVSVVLSLLNRARR